ncbi:lipopolysaccharide biosynthesis protein [Acinetobacter pittii]|uniref:lipopolysaccharide biosynthesis protein n=1 Tax=Acinetobacter pittii TaxID=48296 RepID=UPI00190192CC|nr:oligosaccharide flippase family protein [Acinetobacter pittii]
MKSLLVKINNKLNAQGGFLKAVSVLVGGTAFAQALAVLALPFLTRLYSPAEFSIFAVYTSILGILTVASCLRFEIAIPIPNDDKEAVTLTVLALISNFFISTLIGFIIWCFHTDIISLLKKPEFEKLIWLVPVGVFFSGIYTSLQYWFTRKKSFTLIAKTRVVQSISGTSTQLIMGSMGYSAIGLVLGQIIKISAGIRKLGINFWNETVILLKNLDAKYIWFIFKKNDQFPKYSTLDSLANSAGIQLPILIIATLALGSEVGYLMIAMQVMAIPIQLISGAVSQVYLADAPVAYENKTIAKYTQTILENLIKYGVSVLIIIGILSPIFSKYIFGIEWTKVGFIISWMVPWFAFQLLASPISMIMHIAGKQKQMLLLTIFGFCLRIGMLYSQFYINPSYLIESYAISGGIFYFICYIIFSSTAGLVIKDHFVLLKKVFLFVFLIACSSLLFAILLREVGL